MQTIVLRPIVAEDSLNELTRMLHRAFARLGRMGLNCFCVDQTADATRQRIAKGECFVAESDGRIVGSITLCRPESDSESATYRSRTVAKVIQFAVDTEFQGRGLGLMLLDLAESWATRHGYREIALDTPEPAEHLIAFYRHFGFHLVEAQQFAGRAYRSAVLLKKIIQRTHCTAPVQMSRGRFGTHTGALIAANNVLSFNAAPSRSIRVPPSPPRTDFKAAA